MANTTSTILLLIPTFLLLLLIFFYSSFNFHLNQFFNTNPSPNLTKPSNNYSILTINHVHHANHSNVDDVSFFRMLVSKEEKKQKYKRSKLNKVEDGLARARSAIRKASRTKNYTSEIEETFVPRGPVYRNPFAFHQSHIEMIKRFKIFVYKEGEPPFVHQGPVKGIYGIEGMFIDELESGLSKFITSDPNEAQVFFLPISVARIVTVLYRPLISYERGPLHRVLLDYVNVVSEKYPFWNRSGGADHFMLSCHDWAPEISDTRPKYFDNFIRVLCNANTSEGFQPSRDVSIPEVNIPPEKLGPPSLPTRPSKRKIFAFFAGGIHGHVRKKLFAYWKKKDDPDIQINEYLPKNENYFKVLGQSKFCLCPSGYEVASPRIVEAIFAECVPVLIKDNYSFPFNDVLDWTRFSVHVPVARIPEIKDILKRIPTRDYLRLLNGVRSVKRHFTLNRPAKPFDLIHMMLHSVWLRRLNVRLPY